MTLRTEMMKYIEPVDLDIINSILQDSLTYVPLKGLLDIVETIRTLEAANVEGVLIEAGCAAGGSAIAMAAAKSLGRKLEIFDTFEMIPPPSASDGPDVHSRYDVIKAGKSPGIGDKPYYGYVENLLDQVRDDFRKYGFDPDDHNVHFRKGLYEHTLKIEQPVLLAHIDCDWYESVRICLERIVPSLALGGQMIIDDYHVWSGCRNAVDKFFADKKDDFRFIDKTRMHIIKVQA